MINAGQTWTVVLPPAPSLFIGARGLVIAAPEHGQQIAVAYHSACSMQHGQQIREEPKRLLRAAGYIVRDVNLG
jgi:Fe-S oxidoreductase